MNSRRVAADNPESCEQKRSSGRGDPAWEIAHFFPRQGDWTETDFLAFESASFPVELVDGCLEFLPMPTYSHQRLVRFLFLQLHQAALQSGRGKASFAPCPIRLWDSRYREPDVFFLSSERIARQEDPLEGAEIVIEVVSPGQPNRDRDLVSKRADYARAGIPEYWIVDPERLRVTVLVLGASGYGTGGEYTPGETALSKLLPEFTVDVAQLFASATQHP